MSNLGLKVIESSLQVKALNSAAQPMGGVTEVVLNVKNWQGL